MTTKEDVAEIRKLIKKKCPTISVRMDRGTAYGWVDISAKGGRTFSQAETKCLSDLGLVASPRVKTNWVVIAPEDRSKWIKKLKSRGKPWAKRAEHGYN